jgi:hypothetical protein
MRRRTVVAFAFFVARACLRQMRANSIRSVLEGMGHPHSTNVHRDACMMPFASREDCDAGHRVAAEQGPKLTAIRRERECQCSVGPAAVISACRRSRAAISSCISGSREMRCSRASPRHTALSRCNTCRCSGSLASCNARSHSAGWRRRSDLTVSSSPSHARLASACARAAIRR